MSLKNRCLLPMLLLVAACHHSYGFLQLSCRGKHILNNKNHGLTSTQIYYQRQLDAATINNSKNDTPQTDIDSTNKLPFKPWPHQVVECHGDYREEAYLENIIGGQLYNNQVSLPKLPVPTLKQTIERFIPSALPLCESDDERQSLIEACDKFEEQAKDLQIKLLQRKEYEKDSSWLQKWWNQLGYLQVRDPVAVHVSYFLSIDDDPNLSTVEDTQKDEFCGATKPDVLRGACAMFAAARVRKRVCSGQLACDQAGKKPLCSTGYKYLFNGCRIPRQDEDTYRIYDPSLYTHAIVASRGYFFAVDFVDDQANPLPLESLIKRLLRCQEMAKEQESLGVPKAIGWLSGCSRDFWAKARNKLTKYKSFDEAMKVLESGALVLCLDENIPTTMSDASEFFWNGKGTLGCNRFFDKSVNIVVNGLGQAALEGEHSMMDGSIPMVIINQIQRDKYARLLKASHRLPSHDIDDEGVSDIFSECWNDQELTRLTKELGELGRQQYQNLTDSVELKTFLHEDYGKQYIKKGKVSPDAFLQLVFQLAAYRCFGKQIATYEATQTRQFIHGRTETARTISLDSKAFVEAMGPNYMAYRDDILAKKKKLKLLRQAAEYHHNYTLDACGGMGVDRHFLGLSLVRKDGEQAPDLFNNPVFERSKTWRLSTSGLPTTPGFGPVVEDGLGIGYGLHSNSCLFHISSRKENKYVDRFCHELVLALKEMKGLLEADDDGITAQ